MVGEVMAVGVAEVMISELEVKTASDTKTAVTAVQEQLEKKSYHGAKRQSPKSTQASPKPCAAPSTIKE